MESSESPRSHFTASKSHSSGPSRPSPKCAPKPNAIGPHTGVKNVPLGNPATASLRGRCPFLRCVTNAEAGKAHRRHRPVRNLCGDAHPFRNSELLSTSKHWTSRKVSPSSSYSSRGRLLRWLRALPSSPIYVCEEAGGTPKNARPSSANTGIHRSAIL